MLHATILLASFCVTAYLSMVCHFDLRYVCDATNLVQCLMFK